MMGAGWLAAEGVEGVCQDCRMLRSLKIADGKLAECPPQEAQVLVYTAPNEGERKQLVEQYKIDEHTLASALDPDEQARLEFEPEHMALIFKQPKNYSSEDNYVFRVASTGLFLFKDRLLVVEADDLPLFDGKPFLRIGSLQDLLLKMLYRSIFHFVGHLKTINLIAAESEQQINTSMDNKYLFNLFTLEKSLVFYLSAINSNAKVFERLKLNAVKIVLAPDSLELLDDLIIENTQCYEQAEIYSNILSTMMDARVSIVSNNLNVLMKTLNIICIGIMAPTLVVSIFSMNVVLPWDWEHRQFAFWLILALAVVCVVSITYYFKRRRW
jgi:magnesium transporter